MPPPALDQHLGLAQLDLRRVPGRAEWRGDCPACGYAAGLVVTQKEGRALWWCASCQNNAAVTEAVRGALGGDWTPPQHEPANTRPTASTARKSAFARSLWDEARPHPGTLVDRYLAARGLAGSHSAELRFHPAAPHPGGGRLPAMIAAVRHTGTRELQAVHRTYLRPDGSGKALVEPAKASLGPVAGGAVQLHPLQAGAPLVVAEGIETALSAAGLFGGTAWAAISAGNLAALPLPALPAAAVVVIAAEPIRRSRVLTGAAFLPGRRCSVHVMMQPVVADKLFGDAMLDGIGMLARTLLVAPESTAGTRMYREAPEATRATLAAYAAKLERLLDRPPATRADDAQVLDPPVMVLAPDAAALWKQFHDHAERALAEGGQYRPIVAFGAKLAEHAGRLAAVLALYADPDAMEVPAEAMAYGIALAQHHAAEMLRLQGAASISPDLRLAAVLLKWWQARGEPHCHLAAIYQRGPNALRDAATARRIIGILASHGWVRRLEPGAEVEGFHRKDVWELLA